LCKLFGISRQGYYQGLKRNKQEKEVKQQIVKQVKEIRKSHKRMGGKKLHDKLQSKFNELGITYGRDKFFDVLREQNLLVRYRKRYVSTTQSKHLFFKYPNLIHDLDITRAEQVFVSDITYIRTKKGFLYLFLITDAYSKRIMGWVLADNMKTINAIRALKMAIKNRIYPERELIHHSDRGFQYCNPAYIEVLEKNNIKISMTTKYDPYENAVAERVNGILKNEYDIGEGFLGFKDAKAEINYSIWLYNNDRPHLSCHGMVPVQAHIKENYKLKKWSKKFPSGDMSPEGNKTLLLKNKTSLKV
jgi:transposase InsO family protein